MPQHSDAWFAGFAYALGQIVMLGYDASGVRHIMSSNGFNLKTLEDAGVEDVDVARIRRVLSGRE